MTELLALVARFWGWSPADVRTFRAWAEKHPEEADAWLRQAAEHVRRYQALGARDANELLG